MKSMRPFCPHRGGFFWGWGANDCQILMATCMCISGNEILFNLLVILYNVSCVDMLIHTVLIICQLDSYFLTDVKCYFAFACMECFCER